MIDCTNGRLEEIKAFAATHPMGESFTKSLQQLQSIEKDRGLICYLHTDYAPMSLYFVFRNIKKDNQTYMNGGVIYHGRHDGFGR